MSDPTREIFEIHIRGSIEDVWHQITKLDEPQETFFNMYMDVHEGRLAVGQPLRMLTRSRKYAGAVGEIVELDPPRRFAHTFRFTHLDDPECTVIYDLVEAKGGVDFRMTLEGLPVGTKTAKQMRSGGSMILDTLKAMVEDGRPRLKTRLLFGVFGLLEATSPKSTLADRWPLQRDTTNDS